MNTTAKTISINTIGTLTKEKGLVRNRIIIHTQEAIELLKPGDILFVKAEGNYSTFIMKDGRKILSSKTLGTYSNQLLIHNFIRPHQSYLVNSEEIIRINKNNALNFCLSDNSEIPVSRSQRRNVISYFS